MRIVRFLAAAIAAAFLFSAPTTAAGVVEVRPEAAATTTPTVRALRWQAIADEAITRFRAADSTASTAFALAYTAQAIAWRDGWTDYRVVAYLDRIYARANPDGGYGLGYAYDVFGDGTVNPASTTYTVTNVGHVGPVLLAGYEAGAVPRAKVKTLVDLTMSTARINTEQGHCVAYSRDPDDAKPGLCVHNVNAGAAWFLQEANAAGVGATGLAQLVTDITRREVYSYLPGTYWWRYADTRSMNDADHNSYSAESMYRLAYPIGREVSWQMMNTAYADNDGAPLVHMRLTALPAGPGAWSPTEPGVTWWCTLGDQWFPEAEAAVDRWAGNTTRLAQVAYYAGRAAQVCG